MRVEVMVTGATVAARHVMCVTGGLSNFYFLVAGTRVVEGTCDSSR